MKINRAFFRAHPLDEISLAKVAYFQIMVGFNKKLNSQIKEIMKSEIDQERLSAAEENLQKIQSAETADALIDFMRKSKELLNRSAICARALELQDEVLPAIVQRYYKNRTDHFLECAATILYHADAKYLEELYQNYRDIWSPYAQALICLLIGMSGYKNVDDFLLQEYQTMKKRYSEDHFDQFPLLALYELHGGRL